MEEALARVALIAGGGALGTAARYALVTLTQPRDGIALPVGTLLVNTLGCLLIGLLQGLFVQTWTLRADYRAALLVGVLGGFTTFSSVAWETFALGAGGLPARAVAYLVLTNALGLLAVWGGYRIGSAAA